MLLDAALQLRQKKTDEMFNLRSLLASHVSCDVEMLCLGCNGRFAQDTYRAITASRFRGRLDCSVR